MRSTLTRQTLLLRYWLFSLSFIPLLSVFGRKLQLSIVARINPLWVAVGVFLLLSLALAHFFKNNRKDGKIVARGLLLCGVLLCAMAAVLSGVLLPIEAVHFLIFAWFGWISAVVFGPLRGVGVVMAIAVGDEVLQYFLPSRVGDLNDVVINSISGLCGVILRGKK